MGRDESWSRHQRPRVHPCEEKGSGYFFSCVLHCPTSSVIKKILASFFEHSRLKMLKTTRRRGSIAQNRINGVRLHGAQAALSFSKPLASIQISHAAPVFLRTWCCFVGGMPEIMGSS